MTSGPVELPVGTRGFDLNETVERSLAEKFVLNGYKFALRYIPRIEPKRRDLTAIELERLQACGLAVMPVQHVLSEKVWDPTPGLGRSYGQTAGQYCTQIGVSWGVQVWLDLEGVRLDTPIVNIIGYCNQWYDQVEAAGYLPGLYVGWHSGLTPIQLYHNLKFERYWGAFNLNADQAPARRSVCMRQKLANQAERDAIGINYFNVDLVKGDRMGGLPFADAPENWLADDPE